MNTIARVILVAVLAFGSGCAKPDSIQQTLVTVDVMGVWIGSTGRPSGTPTIEVRLELEQQGSKVNGTLTVVGSAGARRGPIGGMVAGDV
jgi:hypothetical protein